MVNVLGTRCVHSQVTVGRCLLWPTLHGYINYNYIDRGKQTTKTTGVALDTESELNVMDKWQGSTFWYRFFFVTNFKFYQDGACMDIASRNEVLNT